MVLLEKTIPEKPGFWLMEVLLWQKNFPEHFWIKVYQDGMKEEDQSTEEKR